MGYGYEDNRIDRALDMIGMYNSFEEMKQSMGLSSQEFSELQSKARERYGTEVFS